MKMRWSRGTSALIVVSYVLASNLALASQSRPWATLAVALFVLLLVQTLAARTGPWLGSLVAIGGVFMVLGVTRGELAPIPLMLPPVVVPAWLAWFFGHTLLAGRVPLVERFARAVNAPEALDAEHVRYTRSVTAMWTWALAIMALGNTFLVMCVSPGGLLEQFGYRPGWSVDIHTFLWLTNGIYLLVPAILVAEFVFRLHRFPNYPLRNPLDFARRACERLPAVVEDLRRG